MNPLLKGALLIIASEFCLVSSGIFIRQVSADLPTEVTVLMRNLLGLVVLLPLIFHAGITTLKTDRIRLHLVRSLLGVAAMSCLFYAWANLPLAQAALLKQTAPFFIPIFAFFWLGERIAPMVKWAILLGFSGVLLVLQPQEGMLNIAVLVGLGGAMLGSLAKVVIRRMGDTESAIRIVFYFALFGSCFAALPAAMNWVTPTLVHLPWLLGLAVSSTLAQLLLSRAYLLAPAGFLSPFTYSSVMIAAVAGWLIWNETLNLMTWGGMLLICFAGVLALVRRKPKQI
ncbi:DMT family transporter [Nitrincola alkalilacustris]|uniref:DMT family transporter n=1 Tax=Nitrincola alkalilacustris TaxID=1571224 RepID=UPI00124C63D2|nr:DMT family transporter [Nitrincola alkalilacustris]